MSCDAPHRWFPQLYRLALSTVFPLVLAGLDISGRVVDENNVPVADVRVVFQLDAEAGAEVTAVSDRSGEFRVRLDPGNYLLSAEKEGFFSVHKRSVVITAADETFEVVVPRLQQTSESINVSASAQSVESQDTTWQRTLSGRQIIDVPYPATRDFKNVLRIMPGVLRNPNGRLTFDGGMENQVYYSLNGFNIGDPVSGNFTTRLPVESVRSVEYSAGRYSPELGKGSAGTLAIQTTNGGDQFKYSATNFIPGVETNKGLHIGTWSPRLNVSGPVIRGRAWFSESIDSEYSVAVIPDLPKGQDRTTRWRGANVLHTQFNISPTQILSFDLVGGYEYAPRTGLSALDAVSATIDRSSRQYFGSVKDQLFFSRGMVFEAGYALTSGTSYERPQGSDFYIITPDGRAGNYFVRNDQRSRRDQVIANLFLPSFRAAGEHQLKTGADVDFVTFRQNAQRTAYENLDRYGRVLSRTSFGGASSLTLDNLQTSAYVVDVWKVRQAVTLEYGFRVDRDRLVNRFLFSPRIAASWALGNSGDTKISGGYAVIHDATNLAMFARPLDQYSITTHFESDGTPIDPPSITVFRGAGPYYAPRYRNLSAGVEHRFGQHIRVTGGVLRRRGARGFTYAATGTPGVATAVFVLSNLRRDLYDSASVTLNHTFGKDYGWMVNYTASRALSNAVIDISVDQPLQVNDNLGRLAWDVPHRLLSWGYLPGWNSNWAVAYLLEWRSGFPFSVVRDTGEVVGGVNSNRFPPYFSLNLHLERKFRLGKYRFAIRAGVNNLTNSLNATGVNNVLDSDSFLRYYGAEGRHVVFRLRWLRQGE